MKNPILISTAYIKELLEDPSIELIEVWDKILYVRMKQGSGKNKFISKKGLTFNLSVYYYESNYRNGADITTNYRQRFHNRTHRGVG